MPPPTPTRPPQRSAMWRTTSTSVGVGVAAFGVLMAAASALVLLGRPDGLSLQHSWTLVVLVAASAFGGTTTATMDASFIGTGGLAAATANTPFLTLTVLTAAAAVAVHARAPSLLRPGAPPRQRPHPPEAARGWGAIASAAGASAVFSALLGAVAASSAATTTGLHGTAFERIDAERVGAPMRFAADATHTAAGAFTMLLLILVTASGIRAASRVHTAAPLAPSASTRAWRGAALILAAVARAGFLVAVLLPFAGAVGYGALLLFGADTDAGSWPTRTVVAVGLALSANAGVWLLSLGLGAPVHGDASATDMGPWVFDSTLSGPLTHHEPGLWVAPVVAVAVVAAAVECGRRALAGRKAGGAGHPPENGRAALVAALVAAGVGAALMAALAWGTTFDAQAVLTFTGSDADQGLAGSGRLGPNVARTAAATAAALVSYMLVRTIVPRGRRGRPRQP